VAGGLTVEVLGGGPVLIGVAAFVVFRDLRGGVGLPAHGPVPLRDRTVDPGIYPVRRGQPGFGRVG
jgi:hypothetical protein